MKTGKDRTPTAKRLRKGAKPQGKDPKPGLNAVRAEMPADKSPADAEQFVKELGEAALHLLPGNKLKFSESPDWWDSFLLTAKNDPETAGKQMVQMGNIVRGGVQSVVEWACTAKHLPEVQAWAQTCLADVIVWLKEFGFANLPRSPDSYGTAFHDRWTSLNPDGRGPSKFAVVKDFAHHLLRKSDSVFEEIMTIYPDGLPDDAPISSKGLWNFVHGCVKWRFKEGDKFVDKGAVRHMWEFYRRSDACEEIIWCDHHWPLMQELWPSWIREPGRDEFVGYGKVIFGLPLVDAKKNRHGKPALEPSKWKDAVRGNIKRISLFERLFHGH